MHEPTTPSDRAKQGIAAMKSGDKATARQLLTEAATHLPNNQNVLLWLAACTDDPHEKRTHLEHVVAINPHNEAGKRAAKGLAQLSSAELELPSLADVFPPSPGRAVPAARSPAPEQPQKAERVCVRCEREIGLMGSIRYNKQTGRCGKCEGEIQKALQRFRQAFLKYCSDGILSAEEWNNLQRGAMHDRLNLNEALRFVRADALHLLERTLTFAFADGSLTDQEAHTIRQLQSLLMIPDDVARPVLERMAYLLHITRIRNGDLPTMRTSATLDSGEICHMETDAIYRKVTAKAITPVQGRLILTNKQIHFLSSAGGWTIKLKNIMRVSQWGSSVNLELTTKKGNGQYDVPDSLMTEAVIDAMVRIDKRQMLTPQTERASRHISHEVRIAVWNRDQGQCTQCGAREYLEYDHIIPHSKGGASTVNNVQLLCRKCNLAKSDRI